MTLLELLNTTIPFFLLPDNDGQPATFPTPAFGDYLADWAHYLRTHAPYADDLHQAAVYKYFLVETALIYFFLIAALRRFAVAQIYLLVKIVTLLILLLTSGASYWNFLTWPFCFLAYSLELLTVFMFSTWAFHRHALSKINKKTKTYVIYKPYTTFVRRKDGSMYRTTRHKAVARHGLFNPDRRAYQGLFMLTYTYAKYKLILGNPLAYFNKLWADISIDNQYLVAGPIIEPEFGLYFISWTTKMTDRMYRLVAKKYPLVQELHRRADAVKHEEARFATPSDTASEQKALVDFLHAPIRLFGVDLPWVTRQNRFKKNLLATWAPAEVPNLPYQWVPISTPKDPIKSSNWFTVAGAVRDKLAKPPTWKELYDKENPVRAPIVRERGSVRTLVKDITALFTADQFTATRGAILTSESPFYSRLNSTKKRTFPVGTLKPATMRYRAKRMSRFITGWEEFQRNHEILNEYGDYETVAVPYYAQIPSDRFDRGAGFATAVKTVHRRRHRLMASRVEQRLRTKTTPVEADHRAYETNWIIGTPIKPRRGRRPHYSRVDKGQPVPRAWEKKYEQPEIRTGSTGFTFEQFEPLMELDSISNLRYGLLFILALSSLTVYSIILAGWSSNSKYAFLGALRSAAQMISYEVSISLALLPVILLAGSLNLTAIVYGQIGTVWYLFPLLPIALVFLVSMLAETNRTPFDLPEAEAELVAGYNVDYSSLPFAMFFLGEYSNMILISVLFCLLFLGGWDGAVLALQEPYVLTIKAAFVWVFFVIVRATLPRYRYDQLMDIGWKAFLPFAGSFLVFVISLVIFLDVAPVVEEVALEDLYGAPAPFLAELPSTSNTQNRPPHQEELIASAPPWPLIGAARPKSAHHCNSPRHVYRKKLIRIKGCPCRKAPHARCNPPPPL